jgi:branched-subunit amino acid transport protein
MRLWLSVAAVIVANALMKAIGPLVVGDRPLPATMRRVVALMAPVLLAGLIVVELGGEDWSELDYQRVVGVAVAGVAFALRAPMLLAVLLAMVSTALLRFLFPMGL